MIRRRLPLCTIENLVEIVNGSDTIRGNLVLSLFCDVYQLHFVAYDGTPCFRTNAIFQQPSSFKDNGWKANSQFLIDCSEVKEISFHEPLSLSINLANNSLSRKFRFLISNYESLSDFIEFVIVRGIGLVSGYSQNTIDFYPRCHSSVYSAKLPDFHISSTNTIDLAAFMNSLYSFQERVLLFYEDTQQIPKESSYPLGSAAVSAQRQIIKQSDTYINGLPMTKPLDLDSWKEHFSPNGVFINIQSLKNQVYLHGTDPSLIPEILPYILNIYPENSTIDERNAIDEDLKTEFSMINESLMKLSPAEIAKDTVLSSSFKIIHNDVDRTDRNHPAFINRNGEGLKILMNLLKCYCIHNPVVSYLQGMNDLFVPFILAYIPHWDSNSNPVNQSGESISSKDSLFKIFWTFESMLKITGQVFILKNVTEGCTIYAKRVFDIVQEIAPVVAVWLKRNSLEKLVFTFSEYVLMYKRSYDDIWDLWIRILSSPIPEKWLINITAAIIITGCEQLVSAPDSSITSMMDAFAKVLTNLKLETVIDFALFINTQINDSPE